MTIWRLFMNQVVVMGLYSTSLASGNSTLQWSQSDQRKLPARQLFLYQVLADIVCWVENYDVLVTLAIPYHPLPTWSRHWEWGPRFWFSFTGKLRTSVQWMGRVINSPTLDEVFDVYRYTWKAYPKLQPLPPEQWASFRWQLTCLDAVVETGEYIYIYIHIKGRGWKLVNYHGSARCI